MFESNTIAEKRVSNFGRLTGTVDDFATDSHKVFDTQLKEA
jgi:hypothetical protein